MSFFNLQSVNEDNRPVSQDCFLNSVAWKSAAISVSSEATRCVQLPRYQSHTYTRLTLLILGVIFALSLVVTSLVSARFSVVNLSLLTVILAIVLPMILLIGGAGGLYYLSKKTDIFSGTKIDPFGKRCWVPTNLFWREVVEKRVVSPSDDMACYTDVSTLDSTGSGIALVYLYPKSIENRVPMFVFPLLCIPLFVLGRMIYNLLRAVVIPFYILLRICIERCCHRDASEKCFIFSDIIRETSRSLWNALKAPFYGSAYYIALFYGLLNPLAGRVAISCLERDWNDDVIRSRGVWLFFPQKYFKFEGGGGRYGLAQHAFYSMGCFQPCALLHFKNGKIISAGRASIQHTKGPTSSLVVAFLHLQK